MINKQRREVGPSTRTTSTWRGRSRSDTAHAHLSGSVLSLAYAEFLGRVRWEVMITLTFDPRRRFPVSRDRAVQEAIKWANTLAYAVARPIGWLIAAERGRGGSWHAHVLIVGVDERAVEPVASLWRSRNGRLDIKPVYEGTGAVLYTTKTAADEGQVVVADTLATYLKDHVAAVAPTTVIELHPAAGIEGTATATGIVTSPG